jgi:hypothetical protein
MVSVEKSGTPEELVHYGIKGMRWGVRKPEESKESQPTGIQKLPSSSAQRKARAKKVAIGVGVLTAVAGAGFVAYKLHQSGKLPISSIKKTSKSTKAVKEVLAEQTDVLHASRGKTKGFRFFKSGGVPTPIAELEKAFGVDQFEDGLFKPLGDGRVAASFLDPRGRKDQSGRPIPHQVIIPKVMAAGLKGLDDVINNIWPMIEESYSYE